MGLEVTGWGSKAGQTCVLSNPQILDLSTWPLALLSGTSGMCSLALGGLLAGKLIVRSEIFS